MKPYSTLSIQNLYASVAGKEILHGIDMSLRAGEVHAVMGPNGSGKSTLASVLLGHPAYEVPKTKKGKKVVVLLDSKNMLSLPTEERANKGLFLAFQSPIAIPGVTIMNLLRAAYEARYETMEKKKTESVQNPVLARRFQVGGMPIGEFTDIVKSQAKILRISDDMLRRGINDGFSGGEKKKIEMLQALVLPHKFAIFDEIDTGLDVDALKTVSRGIALLQKKGIGVLIITHYQRILRYVKPDVVHILVNGKIVDSGDATLARKIESKGYDKYLV